MTAETYTIAEILDAFDHIFDVEAEQLIRPYDRLRFIEFLLERSKENVAKNRDELNNIHPYEE